MNAPPTFESFLLYDGEKKITREQDTKVPVSSNATTRSQFLTHSLSEVETLSNSSNVVESP